ncbi:MAG: hypothetical protein ACRD5M_04765 [Candidatus Acidiferrales bacterium]
MDRELESIELWTAFPPNLALLKDERVVRELAIFEAARLAEIADVGPRDEALML